MQTNIKDFGWIILTISKEEIEAFDHTHQLQFLKSIKNEAKFYNGKINIMITGYDNDKRGIWEIEEIKKYFNFLDKSFPYWFYFLDRTLKQNESPQTLLMSVLIPFKNTNTEKEGVYIEFDETALKEYCDIHFHFLNELTDELGMTEDENKNISKEIFQLILGNETES